MRFESLKKGGLVLVCGCSSCLLIEVRDGGEFRMDGCFKRLDILVKGGEGRGERGEGRGGKAL